MFDETAAMELVDKIYDEVDDMEPSMFLATIGTVMKIYSVKHNTDMPKMAINLTTVLLQMEEEFKN